MEKINLVELLKDCPEGMELDCTMYEDVCFYKITDDPVFPVRIKRIDGAHITLTKYGGYADCPSSKCVIFPKGKTTWEGFVPPIKFKDGDIIYIKDSYDQEFCSIYKCIKKHFLYTYVDISLNTEEFNKDDINALSDCDDILKQRFATEEEKAKLFQAIDDNGYRWNLETKNLEKLVEPMFKDGDILALDTEKGAQLFIFKEYIHNDYVKCYMMLDCGGEIGFESGEYYVERLATEEEKEKLFLAIKKNGYKWNPETKALEELIESKEDAEDKTVMSGIYFDREYYSDEVELHLNNYEIEIRDGKTYAIFKNKETKISKPIFKVEDKIRHKSHTRGGNIVTEIKDTHYILDDELALPFTFQDEYELVPNKFDINTLVPFESKVLVRNDKNQYWIPAFWGCKRADGYTTTFGWCKYCVPFDGNEHLLDSNNECDKFYRTWIDN